MIRNTLNLRHLLANRLVTAFALAAAAILGTGASPAHAGGRIDIDIGIRTGPHSRTERVWVEPVYETRIVRVWVEPVYRTVADRVWVEPRYHMRPERVWRPGVVQRVTERVLVPARYEYRYVERIDAYGRRYSTREYVQVCPARYEDRVREVEVSPGCWETVERRVRATDGYWQTIERQELVCPGRYEDRTERVCVRPGHWEERRVESHGRISFPWRF